MPVIAELVAALDGWFDPRQAEAWDAVGLVCGDPGGPVSRVLLAVDAVPSTVDQASEGEAQFLLPHHPLLLTGVHGERYDDPKRNPVHRIMEHRLAHFEVLTNAGDVG